MEETGKEVKEPKVAKRKERGVIADDIRKLAKAGKKNSEIAKILKVSAPYVSTVLSKGKKGKKAGRKAKSKASDLIDVSIDRTVLVALNEAERQWKETFGKLAAIRAVIDGKAVGTARQELKRSL